MNVDNPPLHIVMTPVRNEAWVLRAFLTATSAWADYIVIADQMSTDGSRAIYKEFPKVTVIDNTNPEFNEAERQAMLVAKAREIAAGRDTLLWGLDADEIIAADAFETDDWKEIMNSQPGAVFWFRWAQLTHDKHHYFNTKDPYPWLFHDDGVEPHGNYVRAMHSMRIPYPKDEHDMHYVKDFRVLHLGPAPLNRVKSKERFYMFVDWQVNHTNPVSLGRSYIGSNAYPDEQRDLPDSMIYTLEKDGWDMWSMIDLDEEHSWMDDYIVEHLNKYPMKQMSKLPLWTPEFLQSYQLKDPRSWYIKLFHWYIYHFQARKNSIFVRALDKVLKRCCRAM